MESNLQPFREEYFLGYINKITAQFVSIHFPSLRLLKPFVNHGQNINGGLVGSFILIEGNDEGFLGKLVELSLPEKDRNELSEKTFETDSFKPSGRIEVLASFSLFKLDELKKGLSSYPSIGAKVFICPSEFTQHFFKSFGLKNKEIDSAPSIELGNLLQDSNSTVSISLQSIFGRHCAVIGTTGGGKSFTVSKLLEGIIENGGKSIIIDPTGEYSSFESKGADKVMSFSLSETSYLSYKKLTISDLFLFFRPSGQVQQPILLEAIKSLKLVKYLKRDIANFNSETIENRIEISISGKKLIIQNDCIFKCDQETAPFKNAFHKYVNELENDTADFDIQKLTQQIRNECYYDNGARWSSQRDERNFGNSTSLLMRINQVIQDDTFRNTFGFSPLSTSKDLIEVIEEYTKESCKKNVLRIGFEAVSFDFQLREILANSIGNHLLNKARKGEFKSHPIVLFLDEAHQFLNKKVKDEYFDSMELNSFDSISKECRKHGLFLTIATQMPRDIPVGTLSQMGTFIAHRLINHFDKESIANAGSSANKSSLDFLPSLGQGEAILMGVDFPMPIMLKINKPATEPNSGTPQFKLPQNEI